MLFLRAFVAFALVPVMSAAMASAGESPQSEERAVENLAVFARVYGYVRFFHPSDQAVAADWDKIGVLGAEMVRDAADPEALRLSLLRVFQPIAPEMRLCLAGGARGDLGASSGSPPEGVPMTYWQYVGIKLSDQPGPYRQRRVVTGMVEGDRAALFRQAVVPSPVCKEVASGLELRLPLALSLRPDGSTAGAAPPEYAELQARLASIDVGALTVSDWRLRVAGVVSVWNVFQHFHPYLDVAGVRWEEALRPALRRALSSTTADEFRRTLMEMLAPSMDGHGFVFADKTEEGGLPIKVAFVEGRIVVVGVRDDAPLQIGDIVLRVDGCEAIEVLQDRERGTPGSPQLRRFRALYQFGEGAAETIARLEIDRDGSRLVVELPRRSNRCGYFFKAVGDFSFPGFAEVRPGVFYVNLFALTLGDYEARLPQLAGARGVIFDWRSDGRYRGERQSRDLQPSDDIIPHLIDGATQTSSMRLPQIFAPDREGWTWTKSSWQVQPKAPKFTGRIVFINDPGVVSYGETCMAMIANCGRATLVGAPTAGCNGNANFIPLPGGFRVMWTGMDVRKYDDSPLYAVGYAPDFPVSRTLRAVREGRDEYLEKAIEVVGQLEANSQPLAGRGK